MQGNRMRRMLQTTLPRMRPASVREGFGWRQNTDPLVVAPNVHNHLRQQCWSSTKVGGKDIDDNLVRKCRQKKIRFTFLFRCRREL